jgi:uncharacterized protein with HEPN domain
MSLCGSRTTRNIAVSAFSDESRNSRAGSKPFWDGLSMFSPNQYGRIGCGVGLTGIAPLPSEKPILRLEDILDNIDRIQRYTRDLDFDRFLLDTQCHDAVERCWLRISEAAKKLEGVVDLIVPDQPWMQIRAVGNVLRHDYDEVDPAVIWQIVTTHLSPLERAVETALTKLRTEKDAP